MGLDIGVLHKHGWGMQSWGLGCVINGVDRVPRE